VSHSRTFAVSPPSSLVTIKMRTSAILPLLAVTFVYANAESTTYPLDLASHAQYNPRVAGSVNTFPRKVSSALVSTFETALRSGAALGGAAPGGALFVGSFGQQDLGAKKPVPFRLDNHFRIGSITKTFVGSAVLGLVQRGRIKLSDVSLH
jgi:CubicO group peptidase (beta-lactamase class C family)